jgi:hypothetical protein
MAAILRAQPLHRAALRAALGRRRHCLSGVGQVAFVNLEDTVRATYGYAKQGAERGYTGVNGLNALLATLSTPLSAPVLAATRLRRGSVNSVRGAADCSPTFCLRAARRSAGFPTPK